MTRPAVRTPRTVKPKHLTGRPPADAILVERLTASGDWIADDGKPGVAFSGRQRTAGALIPYAWAYECPCSVSRNPEIREACPLRIAIRHTSARFGAANSSDRGQFTPKK